jgi:hypothetical protein
MTIPTAVDAKTKAMARELLLLSLPRSLVLAIMKIQEGKK